MPAWAFIMCALPQWKQHGFICSAGLRQRCIMNGCAMEKTEGTPQRQELEIRVVIIPRDWPWTKTLSMNAPTSSWKCVAPYTASSSLHARTAKNRLNPDYYAGVEGCTISMCARWSASRITSRRSTHTNYDKLTSVNRWLWLKSRDVYQRTITKLVINTLQPWSNPETDFEQTIKKENVITRSKFHMPLKMHMQADVGDSANNSLQKFRVDNIHANHNFRTQITLKISKLNKHTIIMCVMVWTTSSPDINVLSSTPFVQNVNSVRGEALKNTNNHASKMVLLEQLFYVLINTKWTWHDNCTVQYNARGKSLKYYYILRILESILRILLQVYLEYHCKYSTIFAHNVCLATAGCKLEK